MSEINFQNEETKDEKMPYQIDFTSEKRPNQIEEEHFLFSSQFYGNQKNEYEFYSEERASRCDPFENTSKIPVNVISDFSQIFKKPTLENNLIKKVVDFETFQKECTEDFSSDEEHITKNDISFNLKTAFYFLFFPEQKIKKKSTQIGFSISLSKFISTYEKKISVEGSFECDFCEKMFSNKKALGGHIARVHPGKSTKYSQRLKISHRNQTSRDRRSYYNQILNGKDEKR